MEQNYEFRRNKYLSRNPFLLDDSLRPSEETYVISNGAVLSFPGMAGEVVRLAAAEFQRFLLESLHTSIRLSFQEQEAGQIRICIDDSYKGYKSYRISVAANGISILAHDDRGAQQALYHLEGCLRTRRAPFLSFGLTEKEPLFSPRMVHSGFGDDVTYPDVHLREIAYAGMDAIIYVTGELDFAGGQYFDLEELIFRASRYGLDVYLYSAFPSKYAPDDPAAEAYYESIYGELFKRHKGLKGVVFVGESIAIPTSDPNSMPTRYDTNFTDGVPNDKPSADVWPCVDYAHWVTLVKNIIRRHSPSADVVFWTYNFGNAPLEHRKKLIEALPTDISLMVTFEMFETLPLKENRMRCTDYTLAFEGPGYYFKTEAELAKQRGIRLYAMSNTAGRTWDFGTIPYEPMPQQWMKRFAALKKAREDWGLCGLIETHHYGFWPSIITELGRACFESNTDDTAALWEVLCRNYGQAAAEPVRQALAIWSRAITKITPTSEDQYGAFRVGPAYPFNLVEACRIPRSPKNAPLGFYSLFYSQDNNGGKTLTGLRIRDEIESLSSMLDDLREGLSILNSIENPCRELQSLINIGRFTVCCVVTGMLAKRWFLVRQKLILADDPKTAAALCDEAAALLLEERKNVEEALPLVRKDSRLGFEPNMGYVCSEKELNWKLRQLDYVLHSELRAYRSGIDGQDPYERLFMIYTVSRP